MTEAQPSRLAHAPEPPALHELAAQLAGKLCHDLIAPAGAIITGLDMLEDPDNEDLREDALALISASGRKLAAALAFDRIAYGASAAAETFDVRALEALARDVIASGRVQLEWAVAAQSAPKLTARVLLNLAQIGAGAVATGGVARVSVAEAGERTEVVVRAEGARAMLRPEAADGLLGLPLGERLAGHWVQAFYVHALIKAGGGQLEVEAGEGAVVIRALLPRE
jgi:histidine phosphotransferase ChpT